MPCFFCFLWRKTPSSHIPYQARDGVKPRPYPTPLQCVFITNVNPWWHFSSWHVTNADARFSLKFSVPIYLLSDKNNKYFNNSTVHHYLFCKFHLISFVCAWFCHPNIIQLLTCLSVQCYKRYVVRDSPSFNVFRFSSWHSRYNLYLQ